MNMVLRNETEKDYFAVENLTREAFWNVYKPGCDEHLLVHQIRSLPCFIQELDIVAEVNAAVVGSIIYSRSKLTDASDKEHEFITFGPISVHPGFQKRGIGSALIKHTIQLAGQMGYTAIFITGNPAYYTRFGFERAFDYAIHLKGVAIHDTADYFMVKQLKPDVLNTVSGVFEFDPCFEVDPSLLDAYDKQFPPKVKEKLPGQLFD